MQVYVQWWSMCNFEQSFKKVNENKYPLIQGWVTTLCDNYIVHCSSYIKAQKSDLKDFYEEWLSEKNKIKKSAII